MVGEEYCGAEEMASQIARKLLENIRDNCSKKVYIHSNKSNPNNDILDKTISKMIIRYSIPIALSTSLLLGGIFTLIYFLQSLYRIPYLNIFASILMIVIGSTYLYRKYRK